MTDDEQWARWNGWLEKIREDVEDALFRRRIFQDVRAMIDENPLIRRVSSFWDWMAGVYEDSAAMAVRRQLDNRNDSVSLVRLLTEIRRDPQVLSRSRFVALYDAEMQPAAELEFDRYIERGAQHIDPATVESDLE